MFAEVDGAPAGLEQWRVLALTNYGHFTSMRVEDGGVRGLSLHLDRLQRDCRAVFDTDLDVDRVRASVRRAVDTVPWPMVVRVTVFDPALDMGHPGVEAQPQVLVTARSAGQDAPSALRLGSVTYEREMPEVKHVALFGALHQRRAVQRAGFDDAVFTAPDGALTELATSNIGFVTGHRVVWPAANCLPGVTVRLLADSCGQPDADRVGHADLAGMDAVFATNAAVGVRPICGIDGWSFPADHPVLERLRARYAAVPVEAV